MSSFMMADEVEPLSDRKLFENRMRQHPLKIFIMKGGDD